MPKNEGSTQCIVQNKLPNPNRQRVTLLTRPSQSLKALYQDIKLQLDIGNQDFQLYLESTKGNVSTNI